MPLSFSFYLPFQSMFLQWELQNFLQNSISCCDSVFYKIILLFSSHFPWIACVRRWVFLTFCSTHLKIWMRISVNYSFAHVGNCHITWLFLLTFQEKVQWSGEWERAMVIVEDENFNVVADQMEVGMDRVRLDEFSSLYHSYDSKKDLNIVIKCLKNYKLCKNRAIRKNVITLQF